MFHPVEGQAVTQALNGLQVLELAEGIAGPFCGKLMAGLGADVVKVEPPGGDATRRRGPFPGDNLDPEASGLFLYLNTGKNDVVLDLDEEGDTRRLIEMLRTADVFICAHGLSVLGRHGLHYDDLVAVNPSLVMLSITPFGLRGPYSEFRATNLIVHALSGEMHLAGVNSLPPLKKGGNLADYHAGMQGFIAAMAALFVRHRSGCGQHVEVSHLTSLTSILGATLNGWLYDEKVSRRGDADPWSLGTAAQRGVDGTRWGPGGVWQAQDGYVLAYGRASADWEGLLKDMGGELADPRFATTEGRDEHVDELNELFRSWISVHAKEETYRLAQRHRHPYGFAAAAGDLLRSSQLVARGFFVEIDHPEAGSLPFPGAPFIMSRTPFQFGRAPRLGEHGLEAPSARESYGGETPAQQVGSNPDRDKPLAGIRVLDFTHVWAGPYCTRILADLGAQVIKVESITRGDGGCGSGIGRFYAYNRNKLGLTLDLQSEEGAVHIRQLIGISDLVVENFSVGVMKRLGIDYDDCTTIKPDHVYLSMPAFGRTGPESSFTGMGATQEALSGLLSITGHPGTLPNPTGVKYGDPNAGVLGAIAAMTAMWHRRMTGEGQLIDLSQREANICTLPEILLDYAMNERTMGAVGNKHPDRAPRGCYRCAGEDRWIAIDVETDAQFRVLGMAIGRPDLATDPRFAAASSRKQWEEEIDSIIESWTSTRHAYEAMHTLQRAGVPAGAVLTNQQVVEDPHFAAQEFFVKVDADVHAAPPWRFSESRLDIRRAPSLGQHNEYILGEILGLEDREIESLKNNHVIGTEPLASARSQTGR